MRRAEPRAAALRRRPAWAAAGSLGERLRRLGAWWPRELAGCVPAPLRRLWRPRRLVLAVDGEHAALLRDGPDGTVRLAADAEADGAAALRRAGGSWSDIELRVAAGRALRRRISLPAALGENLRESVGYEMDRLTPFRAEEVVYRVEALGREGDRLACDLTVVPRGVVDAALAQAGRLGIRPDRVTVGEPGSDAAGRPVELPVALAAGGAHWLSRRLPAALLVAAAVAGGWLYLDMLDQRQATLAGLQAEAARYRAAAAAAATARGELEALRAVRRSADTRQARRQDTTRLLAELTRLLPDDSWLLELRLGGGRLSMSGYAGSAASLVPLLESSGRFRNTRLSAPVTPDPATRRERFSIEADLAERSAP